MDSCAVSPKLLDTLVEIERSLRPANPKDAAAIIGRLLVHFWQPGRPEGHWRQISEDYVAELREYPLDILEAGRKEALRCFKFMPKISELIEILAPMRFERYGRRDEIKHTIEVARIPQSPNQPPPTDEDKAEVAAAVAKLAGRVARKMTAPTKIEKESVPKGVSQAVRDSDIARAAREMEAAGMAPPSGA